MATTIIDFFPRLNKLQDAALVGWIQLANPVLNVNLHLHHLHHL